MSDIHIICCHFPASKFYGYIERFTKSSAISIITLLQKKGKISLFQIIVSTVF